MKKLLTVFVICLFALPCALGIAKSAEPEKTLSLNLFLPPIHARWTGPLKAWADEIEKLSDGRLKVETFFAEALSPRSEGFDSVKNGIADFVEGAYEANSGQFPFHEGILSIQSPEVWVNNPSRIINEMHKKFPETIKELDGVKLLFSYACPSMMIGTTKKPVRSLEDLKGLKINCNSAMIAERLKNLGVTTVSIPLSDVYTALEQGVIDGTTLPPELLVSRRLGDQIRYMTGLGVQNTLFYFAMNEDTYNNLPEDLQKAVDQASGEFVEKALEEYWSNADTVSLKKWLDDMGGKELIILSDEDLSAAKKAMQPPVDAFFEMLTESGMPGDDMKKTYYELEAKYSEPWKSSELQKVYEANKK